MDIQAEITTGSTGGRTLATRTVRYIDRGLTAVVASDGLLRAAVLGYGYGVTVDVHLCVRRITIGTLTGRGTGGDGGRGGCVLGWRAFGWCLHREATGFRRGGSGLVTWSGVSDGRCAYKYECTG